jgi:hypothetical protein
MGAQPLDRRPRRGSANLIAQIAGIALDQALIDPDAGLRTAVSIRRGLGSYKLSEPSLCVVSDAVEPRAKLLTRKDIVDARE